MSITVMPQNNSTSRLFLITTTCAVVAFCIPVLCLFKYAFFANLWLLYVGNGLFGSVMFISVIYYNKQKDENADLANMISLNLKILAVSVVAICVVLTLLLLVFHHDVLQRAPADEVKDKTNGLDLILYIDAIIVNFLIGSFAVVMASVTAKRRQERAESN